MDGPDQSKPWVIIAVKSEGITPGFTIRDARDDVYFIKFDPPKYPQLATSTEVIVTKFFYAFGYHVPENFLSRIRRDHLQISPEARLEDRLTTGSEPGEDCQRAFVAKKNRNKTCVREKAPW